METVSFIEIEDDPPDLIISFAVWQPELDDIRSIILMRTPEFELLLDESERGVTVSDEIRTNDEEDRLNKVELIDNILKITTNYHQFELDLRKVNKEEVDQAKAIFQKMNFDHSFEMIIV
jgi:nitrate reductase NapAB chaperone NapD